MTFTIPTTLQRAHEALHGELRRATQADGEVGDAAKTLARRMHPHFVKEDQMALPPLGLLGVQLRGEFNAEMRDLLALTDRLEAEPQAMLEEHKTIVAALKRLQQAAERAGRSDIVAFEHQPAQCARTEEDVTYPAAPLVAHPVRRLAQRADHRMSA